MTLQQCVGPEFDVQPDGSLVSRLAGAPATATLPTSGNGLRVDPTRGLWSPAEHHTVQVDESARESPGNVIVAVGTSRKSAALVVEVANPSATRPMLVFFTAEYEAVFNMAGDINGYTGWQLLGALDIDAAPASALVFNSVLTRRDRGVGLEVGLLEGASRSGHMVIDPGGTGIIRTGVGVHCFEDGYVRLIHLHHQVKGIGVTL